MPSTLVIVESPAKAKTIERFLGKGYRVMASFGHVRDLPEKADEIPDEIKSRPWGRMAVDTEGDFTPYYVVPRDKKKQISELKAALKAADQLLLATDEDREGESISWHLIQVLAPRVPFRRIVFNEITEEAIREAVANPRDIDQRLVSAQEGRRILDRLFGYSLSPVLWKKVQGGLSAGRVQSVAVRLLVEREEERRAFRSATYWGIDALFSAPGTGEFKGALATLSGQRIAEGRDFDPATGALRTKGVTLLDEARAKEILGARAALPWTVTSLEEKPSSRSPYAPFTTSTLQQEASRKLGYAPRRTMQVAQGLYEGVDIGHGERTGLITYMRTDSTTLSDKALRQAAALIRADYGDQFFSGPRRHQNKTRNAQEAHEAIRPTDLSRKPADVRQYLEPEQFRLYDLIWKRTIASQMTDARLLGTRAEITAKLPFGNDAVFVATGSKILFPGFLRAYVEGSDDPGAELADRETILPPLAVGDRITAPGAQPVGAAQLVSLEPRRSETQPPARYTEAALIKKLEEEGIGRPSTYATIIDTILSRGYAFKKDRALAPSFVAFAVTELLRRHFNDYVDIGFTARLEETLDEISNGDRDMKDFVRAFYRTGTDGHPGLEGKIQQESERIDFPAVLLGATPDTGDELRVRIGRYGPYIQRGEGGTGNVVSVPDDIAPADLTVQRAVELLAAKNQGPRVLGTDPATGLEVYAIKGRFGDYVQLGQGTDDEKPRRATIPAGANAETVQLADALRALSLPRDLGTHPDSGTPITAGIGRYGPYIKHGEEFRSLEEGDDVHTVTLARAVELLASPRKGRSFRAQPAAPLADLGANAAGTRIVIKGGRFGPYITDGTTNVTVPKARQSNLAGISLDEALEMLAAKAAAGPPAPRAAKGRPARRSATAKPVADTKPKARKASPSRKKAG